MTDRLRVTAEDFNCPGCGEPLGEDNLQEVCGEPFNGVCIECPICGDEVNVNLLFEIY